VRCWSEVARKLRRVFANKRPLAALDPTRHADIVSRMAKPSTPPPAQPSFWLPFVAIGLVGACLGSIGTYLYLRSDLRPASSGMSAMASAGPMMSAAPTAPADHSPPPNLTAGLSPAKADRALGNWAYDHNDWPEAQRRYESAIRQGEDDADIRTDLGNVYRFQGRPADALTQYELAQRLNPQHEFSLFNQGSLFLQDLKDSGRAIAAWRAYLEKFPNGQNAALARQLLAQATGAMPAAPFAPFAGGSAAPTAPANDPANQRLFDLVNQAPAPKKP
jgi:tetratricopeptide (TPR) repeat protein